MKERKAAELHRLRNFEPQISQFSIKTGVYGSILRDYFRICPYAQDLKINWSKISQELAKTTSDKAAPRWRCSKYFNCNYNEHCQPPIQWKDKQYMRITDPDYSLLVAENSENCTARKFDFDKILIEYNEKVLVSPSRLREGEIAVNIPKSKLRIYVD